MCAIVLSALIAAPFVACGPKGADEPSSDTAPDSGGGSNVSSTPDAGAGDAKASTDAPMTPVDAADAAPVDPRDGPGIFSGVGNRVRHVRSLDDGQTWIDEATEIATTGGDEVGIRTVVWGHDQFVAFAAKVFTSPDGKTWSEVTKPDGQWLASMLYAQGQYVSSGGYGWLATTTTDLGNWTQHPPHDDYTVAHHSRQALAHGVVAGSDAYAVVDDEGNLFHSADGKKWAASTGPVVPAGNTWGTLLAFGNGVFVGLLPNGVDTMRSADGGETWMTNTPLPAGATGLVYAQGRFTALGAGHVFTSTDGATWIDHASSTAVSADLTYGHGTYLALTPSGNIFRSTDGLTFAQVFDNAGNPDELHSLAFGPK